MTASIISEGGGKIMLRMPRARTAISQITSNARLIPIGQPNSRADFRNLSSMTRLDRFSQFAYVLIEWLAFHHGDLARTWKCDFEVFDDRGRAAAHDEDAIRQ